MMAAATTHARIRLTERHRIPYEKAEWYLREAMRTAVRVEENPRWWGKHNLYLLTLPDGQLTYAIVGDDKVVITILDLFKVERARRLARRGRWRACPDKA